MGQLKQNIKKIVPDSVALIRQHRRQHGRMPRFLHPQTFNEKILHRLLFDRRPILTQMADKYRVRACVDKMVGPEILTKLYWVTKDPSTIPFQALPEKFRFHRI